MTWMLVSVDHIMTKKLTILLNIRDNKSGIMIYQTSALFTIPVQWGSQHQTSNNWNHLIETIYFLVSKWFAIHIAIWLMESVWSPNGDLNSKPFDDRTHLDHSNTGHVRYSNPNCIYLKVECMIQKNVFENNFGSKMLHLNVGLLWSLSRQAIMASETLGREVSRRQ